MAIAVLPLLALAAWQGALRFEGDYTASQRHLQDRADIIVRSRLNPVAATTRLLKMLAKNDEVRSGTTPGCTEELAMMRAAVADIRSLSVHGADGATLCFAGLEPEPVSAALTAAPPGLYFAATGARADGTLRLLLVPAQGPALSATIGSNWVNSLGGTFDGRSRYTVSVADAGGQILAANRPHGSGRLDFDAHMAPASWEEAGARQWLHGRAALFKGATPEQTIWLVLSHPEPRPFDPSWLFNTSYVLLPFVALLLASLAIWIGADRTILRWVRDIGLMADEIGRGELLPADEHFGDAPTEIRALAAQMKRVSRIIVDRDQTLRRAFTQERLSALELNHRIRNNLQILGSWIAIERARLPAGDGQSALARMELRVAAISLVHRLFYDIGHLALEGPGMLLQSLAVLLENHGIGRPVALRPVAASHPVAIDAAVPVALWLVEAGLCLPHSKAPRPIFLDLVEDASLVCLSIGSSDADIDASTEIEAPALLVAIARQLRGEATAFAIDDTAADPVYTGFRLIVPAKNFALFNAFVADAEQ
jgi:hypothetical protein